MFEVIKPKIIWSKIGIRILIGAIIASIALDLLEVLFRLSSIPFLAQDGQILYLLAANLRYTADQAIYAATIFIVGAKFIETRTIFSVGFDKLDADKVSCKGPDENNIVWIGRRYGTRMEAEAVAQVFESRLKESAGG